MAALSRHRLSLSLALLVPAAVFVTANVLRYELGMPGLHELLGPVIDPSASWAQGLLDAVVFLGPLAAFAVTVLSVLRLRVERRAHAFVGTVEVQWHPALLTPSVYGRGSARTLAEWRSASSGSSPNTALRAPSAANAV